MELRSNAGSVVRGGWDWGKRHGCWAAAEEYGCGYGNCVGLDEFGYREGYG